MSLYQIQTSKEQAGAIDGQINFGLTGFWPEYLQRSDESVGRLQSGMLPSLVKSC